MVMVTRKCEKCGCAYTIDYSDTEGLCHSCYLKKHDGEGWYGWLSTGSGDIEILAPVNMIRAVGHSGDNSQAVGMLLMNSFVSGQLARYSDKAIFKAYEELGLSTDEPVSRINAETALLWSLCWDFVDGGLENTDDYEDREFAIRYAFMLDMVQTLIEYDTDCHYEYEVLRYESVGGNDVVYMAEYDKEDDDIYELTIPIIAEYLASGKAQIFWKHEI